MRACSVLLEEPTELRFDGDVQWDVHALSADFATWMTNEDGLTTATSRVGILSDTEFQQIPQQYLADDVCMHLRLLVKISTLLYNRQEDPHPRLTPHQLIQMRSTTGIRLLQSLEAALKHTALQAASKDKLEGLFLVVVGVIIATKYTSMNGHEEARHELLRILAHYMVLIGDRISLLHCLMTKRRLVENCHNLWNKPGDFAWNYGSSSMKEISDPSPQLDAGLPLAYDWLPDVWPDNSNLMTAVGTTKCGFCNANVPSDDICQVCFGPNLLTAGGEDAKVQADRGCTSHILDPHASDPEATFGYRAPEHWQVASTVSIDQPRIYARYKEPQMAAHQPGFMFHRGEDFIPEEEDHGLGPDFATCEYSKTTSIDQTDRKRTMTQGKPILANNTPRQSSEEQPRTLRFHQTCSICHSMNTRTVAVSELTVPCQHVQCLHCKLVYPEPWLFGPESWVCCQCGDGPKPASSPLAKPCGGRPQLSNTLGGYETCCRNGHWRGLV